MMQINRTYCVDLTENWRKNWCCNHLRKFELVIETVQKGNIWLYGDFLKQENHSWHLFFSWQSARPRKQKKKWRQASLLVNLLLSFLKIKKLESFFQELHNFSICKLDSHGSSIYLAIQDSGGHHSSLILCRRIFRRAWRTWLIQFIKVRQSKILFCST